MKTWKSSNDKTLFQKRKNVQIVKSLIQTHDVRSNDEFLTSARSDDVLHLQWTITIYTGWNHQQFFGFFTVLLHTPHHEKLVKYNVQMIVRPIQYMFSEIIWTNDVLFSKLKTFGRKTFKQYFVDFRSNCEVQIISENMFYIWCTLIEIIWTCIKLILRGVVRAEAL